MKTNDSRGLLVASAFALLGGVTIFFLATVLFPYHSLNHDEAVYLQQAALLRRGRVFLHPPVPDAFRPWFFVDSPAGLYSKYAPYPAALYAVGMALGNVRFALAAVGAAVSGLTYCVASELTDRRIGALAAVALLVSPLFLVDAATFLPYAPVSALNLAFAYSFFRAERTGEIRWAAFAGVFIGGSFFARPYTAVLFALPFVAYVCWQAPAKLDRVRLVRWGMTAGFGLCGVAATLGYNVVVTGHPLVFPYEAFAPADGLGFGHRSLLGYGRTYTPRLALEANAVVVWQFASRWVAGGLLGSALAIVGVWRTLRHRDDARLLVLAGLYPSVVLGNVYFWGNLNVLAPNLDPTQGLVNYLGPYYHFSLLLPTSVFAALGLQWVVGQARPRLAPLDRRATVTIALVGFVLVAAAVGGALAGPYSRNAEITDQYEQAYEPFDDGGPTESVVFLPTIYGPWLNHPMQALRNDPDFDGETVYALDGERSLAVAEAYPNRAYYRYEYRGTWVPTDDEPVRPVVRRIHVVGGSSVTENLTVRIPDGADFASVRVASSTDEAYYDLNPTPGTHTISITVNDSRARVSGANVTPANVEGRRSIAVNTSDSVRTTVYVETAPSTGFSYHSRLPVASGNETVSALSPRLEVCTNPNTCGGGAASIPDELSAAYSVNATLTGHEKNETESAAS